MAEQNSIPLVPTSERKGFSISLLPIDEARIIAIRKQLPGRSTLADAVREALRDYCEHHNLPIDASEQSA